MMAESEVSESWEELEDSGELDKRIQQITILKREPQNKSGAQSGAVMLQEENSQRTAYQPSVKILKREVNSADTTANSAPVGNKQNKTLEQREAEYAEARMRIFGAATSSPEEETQPSPRPERLLQRVEELRVSDNVIRQPRGPDPSGNKGFTDR